MGLLRMSADCNTRWANDDRELEQGWVRAEERMEEVVKKFAYSQHKLDRNRLVRGRIQKPMLEQQVAWQAAMNRERAKKEEEIKALITQIEQRRSGDVAVERCCMGRSDIEAAARIKDEIGIASIRAIEAWSETWDQNLERRAQIWELRKGRWEIDMNQIIENMMAGVPGASK